MMRIILILIVFLLVSGCGDSEKSTNKFPQIAKKDGTFDERSDDLHELCQDFVYYKAKAYKYGREGNHKNAQDARLNLEKTNIWLSEYHEKDVAETCSIYDTKENLTKYMR